MKRSYKVLLYIIALTLIVTLSISSCNLLGRKNPYPHIPSGTLDSLPEFDGETPYMVINDNLPFFTVEDVTTESYEKYGERDGLGRCTTCIACIGVDIMPTEDRESISHIEPTGWNNVKYDFVPDKYVYNRCHLIGFQLTGESTNRENLITGTQFMNIEGMLPFENEIANYVKQTENHVMFRVTPIFTKDNLVANGVLMEAWSVEDNGNGVCFNVYVYNCQPGVEIEYATGETHPKKHQKIKC